MFKEEQEKAKLVEDAQIVGTSESSASSDLSDSLNSSKPSRAAGTIFANKYEITGYIGAGGMSQVYLAKDLLVNRNVAIKIMHAGRELNSHSIVRFQQEARAAGQLSHTNIASVFAFDVTEDNEPYLVMDYVDGKSLSDLIESEGPLEANRAANLLEQMLDGLLHAHYRGVIHRDLKPGNIIVTKDETGKEVVKIVDFGIAKITNPEHEIKLTQTGDIFGSPQYMSPEQCGGKVVDARTDLYSLGCIAFEMFTKRPPLTAENALQIFSLRLTEDAPTMSAAYPDLSIPSMLNDFVAQLLVRDPAGRYQSAEQAKLDLAAIKSGRAPAYLKSFKKPSLIRDFFDLFVMPGAFFERMPVTGGFGVPILVFTCIAIISAVADCIATRNPARVLPTIIELVYVSWALAFLIHFLSKIFGSKMRFEGSFRIAVYSMFPGVLACDPNQPLLQIIALVWTFVLLMLGVKAVHKFNNSLSGSVAITAQLFTMMFCTTVVQLLLYSFSHFR